MYIVRTYECTSQILKKLSQMVQNYSELYLTVPPGPTTYTANSIQGGMARGF